VLGTKFGDGGKNGSLSAGNTAGGIRTIGESTKSFFGTGFATFVAMAVFFKDVFLAFAFLTLLIFLAAGFFFDRGP
jgi:hypothetical protein